MESFTSSRCKTPAGLLDDHPVYQLVVPIASLSYGRLASPASLGGSPTVVYYFLRSESYDVVYYRSLGVRVLVALR